MVVQQHQNFSVEMHSRLRQVRGTVVTDNSAGTGHRRSERPRDLLSQRELLGRVETGRAEENHE